MGRVTPTATGATRGNPARALRSLPAAVALALLGSASFAPGAEPPAVQKPRRELNYVATYRGRVLGTKVVRVFDAEEGGRPVTRLVTREESLLRARGVTTRLVTEREEISDAEGRGIRLQESRTDAGQVVRLDVEVLDDRVLFRSRVGRGPERALPAARRSGPVYFDLDGGTFHREGRLKVGEKASAFVVARREIGIARLVAEVVEEVPLPPVAGLVPEGARGCRIRVENEGGEGEPWEIVCDAEGATVELRMGLMVERLAPADEARLPSEAPDLVNRFDTERVSNLRGVTGMTVEVAVPEDVRDDAFTDSIYGRARREGAGRFVLTLTSAEPDGRLAPQALSAEDEARYRSPSPMVESDDRGIRSFALSVAGDEEEPLRAVLKLARAVHRTLESTSRGPATASAAEAFRAGCGDCTEHAALLTALLRAAGVPARQVMGLVHDGAGFEFHAWTEAYAHGTWIPVDPTLGRMGVPGVYIPLGWEGALVGFHSRANAIQGRAKMRVVAVETAE